MKSFKKYIDAEKYAMEVSSKQLKPISIVHLFDEKQRHKKDFTVMDTPNEWFYGINHVMLITNYETPFELHWKRHKDGSEVIQGFPTKELRDEHFKKLKSAGYNNTLVRVDLTPKQYVEQWVNPFLKSKEISAEYRKTLIEV